MQQGNLPQRAREVNSNVTRFCESWSGGEDEAEDEFRRRGMGGEGKSMNDFRCMFFRDTGVGVK